MRQIKIRVWNKTRKGFFGTGNVEILDGVLICNEDEVIVQSTGLLDKNGKEIYEGDIVESLDKMFGGDGSRNRRVVTFEDGCFQLDGKNLYIVTQVAPNGLSFEPEIIGNIWESPKLLK